MMTLIKEVLAVKKLKGPRPVIEHDMGRVVGNCNIVTTTDTDVVFYALPTKRKSYHRFVKNRSMLPSNSVTISLSKDNEGNYELTDAWIGAFAPPFPGDELETSDSKQYWETHAIIDDTQPVQSKTITKDCPY
jgi:hypothetical protein